MWICSPSVGFPLFLHFVSWERNTTQLDARCWNHHQNLHSDKTFRVALPSRNCTMQWYAILALALSASGADALLRFSCSQLVIDRLDP